MLSTSLQAQARCGFFAGILNNQQSLPVRTMGDKKGGGSLDLYIKNGRTSKNYGMCDADFFWAPKQTYFTSYFFGKKLRQYSPNQKVKISAFTTTCKKYDYKDITCSSIWWSIRNPY